MPWIDSYNRHARLFPSLLSILFPLIAVLAWYPSIVTASFAATIVTVLSSCGLLYFISNIARSKGKESERRLLKQWGGWPTTILLRHGESELDPDTKRRYHSYLAKKVTGGLKLPKRAEEEKDPAGADKKYDSGVKWLIERTRGKDFPLVHKENAQYGFRRNLRGLKPIALSFIVVTLVACVGSLGGWAADPDVFFASVKTARPERLAATVANLLACLAWVFIVTDNWVKTAGFEYARALLRSIDRLDQQSKQPVAAPVGERGHVAED